MNYKRMMAVTLILVIALAPGGTVRAQNGGARLAMPAKEIAGMVDFNGDGFADLAIGVPAENIGMPPNENVNAGAVNVLYGSAVGLLAAGDQFWHQDIADVEGAANPDDHFGGALATGDFDGDAFTDLAIGVAGENVESHNDAGAVNVLYGSAGGLSGAGDQFWTQDSSDVEGISQAGDNFGWALAAGDFNGDGYADLAVGVPNEDLYPAMDEHLTEAGAVNVLYGSAAGLTGVGDQVWLQDSAGDVAELDDQFGWSLASANFGGTSQADLAVGVPGEDIGANVDAGAVNVIYGSAAGLSGAGAQFWNQDSTDIEGDANPDDNFGWSLAAANFGSSSHADLAVGVPFEDIDANPNGGAVNVLYGRAAGLSATGDQLWSQNSTDVEGDANPEDTFGYALAAADFGGRLQADLAIGVPGENIDGNARAGAVNVLYGRRAGLSAIANQLWSQNSTDVEDDSEEDDTFGWALAAGNFGSSTLADLAIGVPTEDVDGTAAAGAVNVLYARSNGLSATADQFWHQNSTDVEGAANPEDTFGSALAAGK